MDRRSPIVKRNYGNSKQENVSEQLFSNSSYFVDKTFNDQWHIWDTNLLTQIQIICTGPDYQNMFCSLLSSVENSVLWNPDPTITLALILMINKMNIKLSVF